MIIKPLEIRRRLNQKDWGVPIKWDLPGGPAWKYNNKHEIGRVIVSYWWPDEIPNDEWVHASISFRDRMPTYEELKLLYQTVFSDGYAYQCFVPEDKHVTFHDYALHLWGRTDGEPVLPEFSQSISGMKMV